MDGMETACSLVALPAAIEERLNADDDPLLWQEVLRVAAEDFSIGVGRSRSTFFAIIGSCSHWLRPHQSRWTAAGGFAAPVGYGDGKSFLRGLPELDWSVTLAFDPARPGWVTPERQPANKRFLSVRIAIPARTVRHKQAAVHAVWSQGTLDGKEKRVVFYGFRKSDLGWKLVASSQWANRHAKSDE